MTRRLLALALLAALAAQPAEARRLPPADRCGAAPGFAAFRADLQRAVARRDAAFILAAAAEDITWSYGDTPGRDGFARQWDLAHPGASPFWREMAEILRLGCARDRDGSVWIPFLSLAGDDDGEEVFTQAVAVGAVPIRAAASDRARLVATLNWDVVTLPENDSGGAWVRVSVDGRRGFVRRSQIRSFGAQRAVFERRGGRWRMTAFVAGD